jgi:hypothetical protein
MPAAASIYEGRTLRACFHRGDSLLGIGATSSRTIPMIQGMPSRHDRRAALSSLRTSVKLYPWRYLICYLYRCEFRRASVFFFCELEDGKLCSCCGESTRKVSGT